MAKKARRQSRSRIARRPQVEQRQAGPEQARTPVATAENVNTLSPADLNNLNPAAVMRLQKTVGNRATQEILARRTLTDHQAAVIKGGLISRHATNRDADERASQEDDEQGIATGEPLVQSGQISREMIQRGWFDDAVDAVSDTASSAVDVVSDTASSAWDTAGDVVNTVADTANSAIDTVVDTASDVANTVGDAASDAWDTVSDTASGAWDAVTNTASDIVGGVTSAAQRVWEGITSSAGAAWDALSDGAKAAWDGVVRAAEAVGGVASDVWEGLKTLGEDAWRQLSSAGRAVWEGIKWFGRQAVDIIKEIGIVLWEKLCFYGTVLWSFISNIPSRLWRVIVDGWEGVTGLLGWLAEGATGFLGWLGDGLAQGAAWALDFIADPSLEKIKQAVKGFVSWLGDGAIGALGWLWDGIKRGAMWALETALHLLELLGLGEALSALWGTIFHLRPLTAGEISASASVHGGLVPYSLVWVDEGSMVTTIANTFGGGRTLAVTTMHILHIPNEGEMPPELAVHELTHVIQYQMVGAIYMAQAIHAQIAGSQYDYGDLTDQHFPNLDREAQAELCEDYYKAGGDGASADKQMTTRGGTVNTVGKMRPLIAEMRSGQF